MATANLGRVGFVAKGAWSAGEYEYLDVVTYTNGSYFCKAPTTTEEPSLSATDWQLIATNSTSEVVDDTTPQLGGYLDTNSHSVLLSKGTDIASATALTVPSTGNFFDITGTTAITSISPNVSKVGATYKFQFDASLALTHNATTLILPSGANIQTQAGDIAEFVEYSTGNFVCTSYQKADGTPLRLYNGLTLTANHTATTGEYLKLDASGGTFTVTLDNTLPEDTEVILLGIDVETNNVSVVDSTSANIVTTQGTYTELTMNKNNIETKVKKINNDWRVL